MSLRSSTGSGKEEDSKIPNYITKQKELVQLSNSLLTELIKSDNVEHISLSEEIHQLYRNAEENYSEMLSNFAVKKLKVKLDEDIDSQIARLHEKNREDQQEIEKLQAHLQAATETVGNLEETIKDLQEDIHQKEDNLSKLRLRFRALELRFSDELALLKKKGLTERQRIMKSNAVIFKILNFEHLPQDMETSVQVHRIADHLKDVSFQRTDSTPFFFRRRTAVQTEEAKNVLLALPPFEVGSPLTKEEWEMFFDTEDGRLKVDPAVVKEKIFKGGIEDSIRKEVWKYLFKYFPWESTAKEREEIVKDKYNQYHTIKNQWQSISPEQLKNFTQWQLRRDQIERDVVRTDRNLECFKEYSPLLEKLNSILLTYAMHFWNVGYTQGMNDMVAPLIVLFQDEVETYWCFKGLMSKVSNNFVRTQIGIYNELFKFSKLLKRMDPFFHNYLSSVESSHVLFTFKWLLLYFKRELELEDLFKLWDVIWSGHVEEFQLFFALAVLLQRRDEILENRMDADHLFKLASEITIDLRTTLQDSYRLYTKFQEIATDEDRTTIFEEKLENVLLTQENAMFKVIQPKLSLSSTRSEAFLMKS